MYIYSLGFFDGVHIGHQELLTACRKLADAHGFQAGVVTFSSHPDTLVIGKTPGLINTYADRERLLRDRYGMDRIITLPFDKSMCEMPWNEFLSMLMDSYDGSGFVCGEDFRFGNHGEGTARRLQQVCQETGYPCAVISEQTLGGIRVSSTHIRILLKQGRMEDANRFLGHCHILSGSVTLQYQLSQILGVPTVNMVLPSELVIPRLGNYACCVQVNGLRYAAVANIGIRCSDGSNEITIAFICSNYVECLNGSTITLEFYRLLQPEAEFLDFDYIQQSIQEDIQIITDYMGMGNALPM